MFSAKNWVLEAHRLTHKLLRAQWLPLLIVFGVSCVLNLGFEDAMQGLSPTEDTQRWVMQLILGVWDLVQGVLLFLILSWGLPKVRNLNSPHMTARPFETPYLASFLAEYLRMLAQILMFGLLLILPGFVRYMQLSFVPFVAIFAKTYRDEDSDALRLSEKIAHGRLKYLFPALFGTMALQFGLEFIPEINPDLHVLPLRVVCDVASSLISVFSYSLIFLLFEHFLGVVAAEE